MITYCLGFAFTDHDNYVVLIRKNKPAWQKGLLNGVGGKIEANELAHEAMVREFREETGITHNHWTRFTIMKLPDAEVHCFATRLSKGNDNLTQMTDEIVSLHHLFFVRNHPKMIPNLCWLIPMALHALNNPDSSDAPHTLQLDDGK